MIKKYWPHLLFVIFLVILIFNTYRDYGIVWDEKYYLNIGKHYVSSLLSLLNISTNIESWDFPLKETHLKSHGVLFDVITALSMLLFKEFSFVNYHLVKALIAVFIFVLLGLLVQKLTKNSLISLSSMILLFFFPRFYGDIFQNSIDVPTVLLFTLMIAYFVYYLNSNESFIKQAGLGFVSALAINQRIILSYVFILNLLLILLISILKKKSLFKFFSQSLVILISTIVFMHLTHPYLFTHPIRGLYDMYLNSKSFQLFAAANLFEGELVWANKLPWYYLPKYILITTPLAIIGMFVIGFFALFFRLFKEKSSITKALDLYVLLILSIPMILIVVFRPILYDGWRHFLFLTIPIIIIASVGFQTILRLKYKLLRGIMVLLVAGNLLVVAQQMIVLHPYQYIYFNELVGGLPGANGKYDTDYFGASYKEAIEWFNKNINDKTKQYRIFATGDSMSSTPFFKKNMSLVDNYNQTDYFISYTRWNLHTIFPGRIIYQVEREGVPLNIIKKNPSL